MFCDLAWVVIMLVGTSMMWRCLFHDVGWDVCDWAWTLIIVVGMFMVWHGVSYYCWDF